MNRLISSSFLEASWFKSIFKKRRRGTYGRQNILLKPTDIELLEEADCTHKLPGSGRGGLLIQTHVTAFGGRAQAKPHRALLPRQGGD